MKKQQGFTLIELMIVIAIIAIIAAIAIPNLLEARKGANESAAISSLRTLVTVQALYRDTDKNGDGEADFAGSLNDLFANGQLIDGVLSTGTKQGYTFTMASADSGFSWTAVGVPINDKTGTRRFFVDESGVMRFTTTGSPTVAAKPIGG